jgi:hypothetical protein
MILIEGDPMPDSLPLLESRRTELLHALANLKDMRPGSVVGAVFRCGKPSCHRARPQDPGHGPNLRLPYKWQGKTVTEALPTSAAVRKAEREIAEFRDYQRLGRELVEVNENICRLRPLDEEPLRERVKNGGSHPAGSHARGRPRRNSLLVRLERDQSRDGAVNRFSKRQISDFARAPASVSAGQRHKSLRTVCPAGSLERLY